MHSVFLWGMAALLAFAGSLPAWAHSDKAHSQEHHQGVMIDGAATVNPWTHLQFNNDPKAFQFAVVTDRTGGLRPGVFSQAVDKLNLLQPEFVVSVGDLIEGYTENRAQLESEWNEFDAMVQRLDMPFFYLAGNHDYTNEVMADVWRERYGASYYHFVYRDVLFVMLNSNDGGSTHTMSQTQIDWLAQVLKDNPKPKWTLVFTHAPLWDRDDTDRWGEVEQLLDTRPYTVFAGHHHRYVKNQRHGREYFTLATTGGISSMRGTRFGEFDHVVWITMSDEGPIIANLMLDGIWDKNVRTGEMRDLQNRMIDRGRLSAPALLHRGGFTEGTAELRLVNDADIPYTLTAKVQANEGFAFAGEATQTLTVPPNEVRTLPVPIKSLEPREGDHGAVNVQWQLRYQHGEETIEYEGARTLAVSRERPINTLPHIELDGALDEWQSVEFFKAADNQYFQVENWQGLSDADMAFALASASDHLVLAIKVLDDHLLRNASDNVWSQDALLITLDARAKHRRLLKPTYDNRVPGERYMVLQPPAKGFEAALRANPEVPDDIRQFVRTTESGYTAEVAIPYALLDTDHGSHWDGVRINLLLRDVDPDEPGMVGREWLPAWDYEGSVAGAGSFYRE
ncbi:metallophosphoesterase [Gilvimarinus algae]|uniref:Metallophosphoesterase n=1 Tax=Gilvimarinus algae TaxID=3058037 RepID=A0ABT8TEK1_9GAMM|nr:metallophosphoesterase [Gilvimarinus sp. SDUM040014]MDO3381818.1 metallophosphoesterase [Gilvimarinus sp. SDUM040014]